MNGNLEIKFEYHYVAMAVAVEIGFFLSQMTLQHGDLITTIFAYIQISFYTLQVPAQRE